MSHFCVKPIFVAFFMLIGFIMASLPEKPDELYKECLELTESRKFTKMVKILRGQIPLKAAKLLMPIDGSTPETSKMITAKMMTTLNHNNVMSSLDSFLGTAKDARKVHEKDVRANGLLQAGQYDEQAYNAYYFVVKHEKLLEKLEQNCGNRLWGTSVETVLDKTVECANTVHKQYVAEESANNQQTEGHAKEHKWQELNAKFQCAILAITQKEGTSANDGKDFVW